MKTYQQTHSWITFQLDMTEVRYKVWLLLGQAQAKVGHISGVPLLPEVADYFRQVYLVKGALATTAIEGNTLTEEEVQRFLQHELTLPPSKEYLGQEIDNVVEAYNVIGENVLNKQSTDLMLEEIRAYNTLVLTSLPLDEDVNPGELRQHSVVVGRYRGAPAEDLEYLLTSLCDWLNKEFNAPKGYEIAFGILKAIIAHVYIAWIHPFADGNGRTARLIEFKILLAVGVPDTAAHLLSNFYNQTRTEYYRQLERTSREPNGILSFVEYALQGFIDNIEEQIKVIESEQIRIHWRNYIYDRFRNLRGDINERKRKLMLDLSEYFVEHGGKPIPVGQLRYVSSRVAELYATKTDKTFRRDISFLEGMELIQITSEGIVPRLELLRAFLPQRRE